jgi:hypothetical protein
MDAPAPYSAYSVNCHVTGDSYWVDSEGMWHLAVLVLTWPGVRAYALTGPSWVYESGGVQRVASIAATAVTAKKELLYFTLARSQDEDSESLEVKRAHAKRLEAQLVVASLKELYARRTEVNNRRDAHAFLYRGRRFRSDLLESKLLHAVQNESLTLGEFAGSLGLNWGQAVLTFLRCWLKEEVQWDIAAQVLAPSVELKLAGAEK